MADWWFDLFEFAEEFFDCPRCEQRAGWPCITKSGAYASHMHVNRYRGLQELCSAAYGEGCKDGEYMATRRAEYMYGSLHDA